MPVYASFRPERAAQRHLFEFMGSSVSTEKPKTVAIRAIARELSSTRAAGGRTLLVGGPGIVHTGSGEHICQMIRDGYIDLLFAGNALATHDIEQALFGTSLGVHLTQGTSAEAGHEHHLRAINRIRRAGGIRRAVDAGLLTSGIMYECVRHDVDFLLAGSIRDDGPLPEVITDTLEGAAPNARADPRRDFLPDDRHDIALDCGRKSAAGLGQGRVRGYQSLDRDQAGRSGNVSNGGAGDGRRAVFARLGARVGRRRGGDRVMTQPRILMCQPDFYGIEYEINAWMDRDRPADRAVALEQWSALKSMIEGAGGAVETMPPVAGLPDLVFTANAAIVYRDLAIAAHFRHPERQGEEAQDEQWLAAHGFRIEHLPAGHCFEGAGDALFCGDTLFAGYRLRSEARAAQWVGQRLGCRVIPLELVDPYYYHLDTCFCPLAPGVAIYYPRRIRSIRGGRVA